MPYGTLLGANGATPTSVLLGSTAVSAVCLGSTQVWPAHAAHADEVVVHTADTTWTVPAWANCVDIVCLGAGAGGDSGGAGMRTGSGGPSGSWASLRLVRTIDVPSSAADYLPGSLTISIGQGGVGGRVGVTYGGPSTVTYGSRVLSAAGGPTAQHLATGATHPDGYAVNPITYTFNGHSFTGGGASTVRGSAGIVPGGGGSGQVGHIIGPDNPGGKGARGQVWTVARII